MTDPVHGFRARPGEFMLAVEHASTGLRFKVDEQTFEVVGEPTLVGTLAYMATVRVVAGPGEGSELQALLRAGRRMGA